MEAALAEKAATVPLAMASRIEELDDIIADRVARLTTYQDARYAEQYRSLLSPVIAGDKDERQRLSKAAARYLYKMMAIKDEYEVARLYSDGQFSQQIKQMFEGDVKLSVHLAPPLLAKQDPAKRTPTQIPIWQLDLASFQTVAASACGARHMDGCFWLYRRAQTRAPSP